MKNISRFFRAPEQNCFLFGPRGTGKSTWLKQHFPNAVTIDLLASEIFRAYVARPKRLREAANGAGGKTIVVDEVQKVSELLFCFPCEQLLRRLVPGHPITPEMFLDE